MESLPATVLLLNLAVMLYGSLGGGEAYVPPLRRQKRNWVIPAQKLKENHVYSPTYVVARIRSDFDKRETLYYTLTGPGASENPINLFVVGETSGLVHVRGKLDREKMETYKFIGKARYRNNNKAEDEIYLRIDVQDENDNTPVFAPIPHASVRESSPPGTFVAKAIATDIDKPDHLHSKIAYSIDKQEPSDGSVHFKIDRATGFISVKDNTLDRERVPFYVLTINGTDMDGAPDGNIGTTTVKVKVVDINDHRPVLEKDEYSCSIMENKAHVEVLRFKVLDADEEDTDNSQAIFDIVSGNDDGIFSIKTDPKTNEGVLMLEKPLNFEENPDLNLGVVVYNKAPAVGDGSEDGGGGGKGDGEGEVDGDGGGGGAVKPVSVSENPEENSLLKVIAAYPATDTDSGKLAENVRYAKGYDPDGWLLIDPETAEIRLKKKPDRESPFVVNGTYRAEILCLTQDLPSKTATGTIALQVGDVNDNCPMLTSNLEYVCSDTKVVNITAEDEDGDPNGAPLLFSLVPEESRGEWKVEPISDTRASLRTLQPLWPGQYQVTLSIKDQQGVACPEPQRLELKVCLCDEGQTCRTAGLTKFEDK
uniref:desmoglein-2.1-like n=1 Tax=Centroberyx gerrardi TaxID=166262 RepID=UPI003AABC8CE